MSPVAKGGTYKAPGLGERDTLKIYCPLFRLDLLPIQNDCYPQILAQQWDPHYRQQGQKYIGTSRKHTFNSLTFYPALRNKTPKGTKIDDCLAYITKIITEIPNKINYFPTRLQFSYKEQVNNESILLI